MAVHYRMCRFSQEILPTSQFSIDQWDCDRVCQQPPFGPKSVPVETSYTIREKIKNETKLVKEGFNKKDAPAWKALFKVIDVDGSGKIGFDELHTYLEHIAGQFEWEDDGDGEMDFKEFVIAMTTRLPPSTEMAIKLYAHSLIGRDLTKESSYSTEEKGRRGKAKKVDHFSNKPGSRSGAEISESDKQALLKVFRSLDSRGSGRLERAQVQQQLARMVGNFEWADDGDGVMNANEFVDAMRHLPASVRMATVVYGRTVV